MSDTFLFYVCGRCACLYHADSNPFLRARAPKPFDFVYKHGLHLVTFIAPTEQAPCYDGLGHSPISLKIRVGARDQTSSTKHRQDFKVCVKCKVLVIPGSSGNCEVQDLTPVSDLTGDPASYARRTPSEFAIPGKVTLEMEWMKGKHYLDDLTYSGLLGDQATSSTISFDLCQLCDCVYYPELQTHRCEKAGLTSPNNSTYAFELWDK